MSSRRSYPDACGLAQALNIVGERWAMLVVRELIFGPRRFTDLDSAMPGISRNVLSQRLDELEGRRVVRRRRLAPPTAAWVYELTDWGRDLEPVVRTLGHWGARSPFFDPDQPLSPASIAMSMRTMFRPELAEDIDLTVVLQLAPDEFVTTVADGRLRVDRRGAGEAADAPVVATDPATWGELLYSGAELSDLEDAGRTRTYGDHRVVERLTGCFRLPESAQS